MTISVAEFRRRYGNDTADFAATHDTDKSVTYQEELCYLPTNTGFNTQGP